MAAIRALCLVLAASAGQNALGDKKKIRVGMWVGKGSDWPTFSAGAIENILTNSTYSSKFERTLFFNEAQLVANLSIANFDVVLFPGGSASGESVGLTQVGRDMVHSFLGDGGGYLGICAGAYLARPDYLNVMNYSSKSPWNRGDGEVQVQFNKAGRYYLGLNKLSHQPGYGQGQNVTIHYGMGPIFNETWDGGQATDYVVLATYLTEISNRPATEGQMVNTPAIITHRYWKGKRGRVLLSSPHPELTGTLPKNQGEDTVMGSDLIMRYLQFCAGYRWS